MRAAPLEFSPAPLVAVTVPMSIKMPVMPTAIVIATIAISASTRITTRRSIPSSIARPFAGSISSSIVRQICCTTVIRAIPIASFRTVVGARGTSLLTGADAALIVIAIPVSTAAGAVAVAA